MLAKEMSDYSKMLTQRKASFLLLFESKDTSLQIELGKKQIERRKWSTSLALTHYLLTD